MKFWLIVFAFVLTIVPAWAKELLIIGIDEMSEAVAKEFVEQGMGENIELEFFGGQTAFSFENANEAKIMVTDLNISEDQNKFTATAEVFVDGKSVAETKLFGRYFEMVEVWLPLKDIAKDEIIKSEDLVNVKMRANRLRDDSITDLNDLLGKQALRTIRADKPIVKKDIREKVLIKKGDEVTAIYTYKGLQITSKMEALEDGAKGQRIKLLNTKSHKEISGRVLDNKTVEIAAE